MIHMFQAKEVKEDLEKDFERDYKKIYGVLGANQDLEQNLTQWRFMIHTADPI